MKYHSKIKFITLLVMLLPITSQADGFVTLPNAGFTDSAYTLCNTSGLKPSEALQDNNSQCAVTSPLLLESPMNPPLEGFRMVGMISRGINVPAPAGMPGEEYATLTDTIWHHTDTNECIFGTHILMKDVKLANGEYWEINDIVRGGFSDKPVAIAYFMKPQPSESFGMAEALFRAGRSLTSLPYIKDTSNLPTLKAAPANDNWVNFTTNISFNNSEKLARKMTAMLYIKTTCDQVQPEEKENAIRLRITSKVGQAPFEVSVPGLVPAGAKVEFIEVAHAKNS